MDYQQLQRKLDPYGFVLVSSPVFCFLFLALRMTLLYNIITASPQNCETLKIYCAYESNDLGFFIFVETLHNDKGVHFLAQFPAKSRWGGGGTFRNERCRLKRKFVLKLYGKRETTWKLNVNEGTVLK